MQYISSHEKKNIKLILMNGKIQTKSKNMHLYLKAQ